MLNRFLKFLLPFVLVLFFPNDVQATNSQFDVKVESSYTVNVNGVTDVSQNIVIFNKTEFYYTPTYTVSVGFSDITDVQAYNADGSIPTTLSESKNKAKNIKLSFPNRYVGINESNTFTLKFSTKDIAKKRGNIWEVTIPGLEKMDEFSSYNTTIIVPDSFGGPSVIKPQKKIDGTKKVRFEIDDIGRAGVYILYGKAQYYFFKLKYNISNPNLFPVRTEIAIPPHTNYQNVVVNSFSEAPINVTKDMDGNWIAEYRLSPQQKKIVVVEGIIEVVSNPRQEELTNLQLKEYTTPKEYWETKDALVHDVSKDLSTPKEIYDYVKKTLSYNYKKIATDNVRLGGTGALKDNKNSVCLEFTDLFVTLTRAKGIPSRSVEGFAFTENTKLRPLSLVNDILHAWPEYYDKKSKRWIMVDPTWGKTTKEMDYFNSLDFSHVAFVTKGVDSEYPIPAGGYKFNRESRDVTMTFAKSSDFVKKEKIVVTQTFPNSSFPKLAIQGTIKVKNEGNIPVSNLQVNIITSKGSKRQFEIDYLPPFGYREITTTFNDVSILTNGEYIITIQVGKSILTKKINISIIPEVQTILLVGGIISVSIITAAITFRTGSLLIQRRKRKNFVRR